MAITEVNLAKLGNVLVPTRTSDNLRLEILDRSTSTQSATSPLAPTTAVPAIPKRDR